MNEMKLFMLPKLQSNSSGGVFEVMRAHRKALQELGIKYTDKENDADLVVVHALAHTTRRPDVYHSHGFYPTSQAGWNKHYNQVNEQLFQNDDDRPIGGECE